MEILSNIVYVVILLLLVIILACMYFFFNDIRKNKNKVNICESDLQALRERMTNMQQKIISMESNINDLSSTKKVSKNNSMEDPSLIGNGPNFAEMLEKLGSLNNNFYDNNMFNVEPGTEEEEEEDEEEDEEEEDEEDEEEVDENEEEDEEEDEEEEDEDEDEEEEEIRVPSVSTKELKPEIKDALEVEEVKEEEEVEEVEEEEEVEEVPIKSSNENIKKVSLSISETLPTTIKNIEKLDSEKEDKPSEKKLPNKPIVKLEIGTIELGTDNKTKYSVQLNKVGRKYWKRV